MIFFSDKSIQRSNLWRHSANWPGRRGCSLYDGLLQQRRVLFPFRLRVHRSWNQQPQCHLQQKSGNTRGHLTFTTPIQPCWLSGLIRHVSNSSRNRGLGPEFESCSGHLQSYYWGRLYSTHSYGATCGNAIMKWVRFVNHSTRDTFVLRTGKGYLHRSLLTTSLLASYLPKLARHWQHR